ncbi:hypothetical protein CDAR_220851 [Caerostris darwini]|uniref:Uncharacterized protein n=1 Tax=Caerostris darwini TaxID=1538125 RepID=A0AAV4PD99_9ARAC|nr:hypothetical protein CDAR_220851 [Caerostris darwini]
MLKFATAAYLANERACQANKGCLKFSMRKDIFQMFVDDMQDPNGPSNPKLASLDKRIRTRYKIPKIRSLPEEKETNYFQTLPKFNRPIKACIKELPTALMILKILSINWNLKIAKMVQVKNHTKNLD